MLKFILDILAPKKCQTCQKEWHFLCKDCYNEIKNFEKICYSCKGLSKKFEVCDTCSRKVFYDKVIVLKHYKDKNFSKIIKEAKFYWKKEIFEELSHKLYGLFIENQKIRKLDDFLIVSVPSFWTRKLKRWYNSSEVLASYFSRVSKIKYDKKIIKKIKNTPQQSKLSRKKRLTNLDKSFIINKSKLKNLNWKNIILVDDVVSTGSTLNEISKELKKNKVKKVVCLVLASD